MKDRQKGEKIGSPHATIEKGGRPKLPTIGIKKGGIPEVEKPKEGPSNLEQNKYGRRAGVMRRWSRREGADLRFRGEREKGENAA